MLMTGMMPGLKTRMKMMIVHGQGERPAQADSTSQMTLFGMMHGRERNKDSKRETQIMHGG